MKWHVVDGTKMSIYLCIYSLGRNAPICVHINIYKFIKETKINKLAYILKKKTYRFFISVCVCCKPWVLGFQKEKETKSVARADARFLRGRPC